MEHQMLSKKKDKPKAKRPPKLEVPPPPPPPKDEVPRLLDTGEQMNDLERDMHVTAKVEVEDKGDAVVFSNIAVVADLVKKRVSDVSSTADCSGNFSGDFRSQDSTTPRGSPSSAHKDPNSLSHSPDATASGVHIPTESLKEMQMGVDSSPLVDPSRQCLPHPKYCCPLMRFGSGPNDPTEPSEANTPLKSEGSMCRDACPCAAGMKCSCQVAPSPERPVDTRPADNTQPAKIYPKALQMGSMHSIEGSPISPIIETNGKEGESQKREFPRTDTDKDIDSKLDARSKDKEKKRVKESDREKERSKKKTEAGRGGSTQHIHFKELTIKERIGTGAYGVVTRCVHQNGTAYALKTVTVNDGAERMLRSELERLKQRRAEYAVQTYEAYYSRSARAVHFLMEYMANGSVGRCFEELKKTKKLIHRDDIALIAERVLLALHQLRGQRIIHKDIKPDNILIGLNSQVKIGDFGISAFANQNSEAISLGTYSRWMAPERINSGIFTYNSDVYSLGFVVAYLALGKFPLSVQSCRDIIFVDKFDKLDLSNLQKVSGNGDLCDFIHQATKYDKEGRPDAEQLLEHPFITKREPPPCCHDKNTLSFLRFLKPLSCDDGGNRRHNRYTDSPSDSSTTS